MSGDKPLFSRAQLSILMVAVTLAIALLSNMDGKPEIPEVQRSTLAGVAVYWSGAHDSHPYALVSLALPNGEAPMLLGAVLQQLASRLRPGVEVRRYPDRWELLASGAPGTMAPLLTHLRDPLSPAEWQQWGNRYRAQRYLEGTLPGSALDRNDNGFGVRAAALHRQLLSRAQLSLSFTGVALDDELAPLVPELEALPVGEPWPPDQGSAPSGSGEGLTLVLPSRGDDGFAATALAIQLLKPLVEAEGVAWQFSVEGGSSRLQLRFPTDRRATLARLDQALAALKRPQIEAARSGLRQSLEASMADPVDYARRQGVLAFYRLQPDYWSRFVATIAALPAEAPIERARGWLHQTPATQGPDHDQETETADQRES